MVRTTFKKALWHGVRQLRLAQYGTIHVQSMVQKLKQNSLGACSTFQTQAPRELQGHFSP